MIRSTFWFSKKEKGRFVNLESCLEKQITRYGTYSRWISLDWRDFVEEKAILDEKAAIDAASGEQQEELTPVDAEGGVYSPAFFDLEKYPTHWKLVFDTHWIRQRPTIRSRDKIVGLDWLERTLRFAARTTWMIEKRSCQSAAYLDVFAVSWSILPTVLSILARTASLLFRS